MYTAVMNFEAWLKYVSTSCSRAQWFWDQRSLSRLDHKDHGFNKQPETMFDPLTRGTQLVSDKSCFSQLNSLRKRCRHGLTTPCIDDERVALGDSGCASPQLFAQEKCAICVGYF